MSELSEFGVILFTSEIIQSEINRWVFRRKACHKQLRIIEIENICLWINIFMHRIWTKSYVRELACLIQGLFLVQNNALASLTCYLECLSVESLLLLKLQKALL